MSLAITVFLPSAFAASKPLSQSLSTALLKASIVSADVLQFPFSLMNFLTLLVTTRVSAAIYPP